VTAGSELSVADANGCRGELEVYIVQVQGKCNPEDKNNNVQLIYLCMFQEAT